MVSPKPIPSPPTDELLTDEPLSDELLRDSAASPAVARATASQVERGTFCLSRIAVKIGVSTTYVPVMNPEREASVCASPIVWASCAEE